MDKRQKLLIVTLFSLVYLIVPITQAHAYSSGIIKADDWRATACDVYQLITINYTAVGEEASAITVIRSDGEFTETVEARAVDTLGSNQRLELRPEVKSIWGQTSYNLMHSSFGNYTDATYALQRTFENNTQRWYNISEYINNETLRSTTKHSGYRFQAVLLPPEDVAYDWCSKNNAVLNSVDAVNTTMTLKEDLVDFLWIEMSEEMEVDTNLDDGYQPVPVSGDFISPAAVGFIIRMTIIIGVILLGALAIMNDWVPFDFSTTIYDNDDQHYEENYNIGDLNVTELWDAYDDYCNTTGEVPTKEGFAEWLKAIYGSVGAGGGGATWNNNWTVPSGDDKDNILTNIVGFLADIGPLIIAVIVIIAFVFGGIYLIRGIRKVGKMVE